MALHQSRRPLPLAISITPSREFQKRRPSCLLVCGRPQGTPIAGSIQCWIWAIHTCCLGQNGGRKSISRDFYPVTGIQARNSRRRPRELLAMFHDLLSCMWRQQFGFDFDIATDQLRCTSLTSPLPRTRLNYWREKCDMAALLTDIRV
jgi:hypothetical protein